MKVLFIIISFSMIMKSNYAQNSMDSIYVEKIVHYLKSNDSVKNKFIKTFNLKNSDYQVSIFKDKVLFGNYLFEERVTEEQLLDIIIDSSFFSSSANLKLFLTKTNDNVFYGCLVLNNYPELNYSQNITVAGGFFLRFEFVNSNFDSVKLISFES